MIWSRAYRALHGRFTQLAQDRRGAAAVEFALIAPALVAAILAMADMGLALNARMNMDTMLRSAAQVAMTDPGLVDLQTSLTAMSGGTGFAATAQLRCDCGTVAGCTTTCASPGDYVGYRLSATGTYSSIITALTLNLSSDIEVLVK